MGPIFDSHAHYTVDAFDPDRQQLLEGLPGQGVVGVCTCATHSGDAPAALALAERFPFIWAAVGIHPESLIEEDAAIVARYKGDWRAELRDMEPLLAHPKAVAVGECGLDYHWPIPKEEQLALFEAQLQWAVERGKPIIVHDREAHADTYALLKKYRPRGMVHCYSGSAEDALALAKQGLFIGFGGAATFKGARRAVEALKALPLEQLLLETDCPYMAPTPVRGTRNHSGNIWYVGEFIAQCRGEAPETIFTATCQNARRLFGLAEG